MGADPVDGDHEKTRLVPVTPVADKPAGVDGGVFGGGLPGITVVAAAIAEVEDPEELAATTRKS